jgi:hypothetical protein
MGLRPRGSVRGRGRVAAKARQWLAGICLSSLPGFVPRADSGLELLQVLSNLVFPFPTRF